LAKCPECGLPVRDSTGGSAVGEAQREAAADAFRLFARSYLPGAGLGFFGMFGCIGVPLQAVALIAAFQRLLALRRCRSEVRAPAIASIAPLRTCQRATEAEVVLGIMAVSAGIGSAPAWVNLGLLGLWFGTALLGACAAAVAVDRPGDARRALALRLRGRARRDRPAGVGRPAAVAHPAPVARRGRRVGVGVARDRVRGKLGGWGHRGAAAEAARARGRGRG
jgi:hypothetical protein